MKVWMRLTGENPLQLVWIRDDALGYGLSDGFLRLIVIDGEWDQDVFRVADALLQEGGEFLDVGANLRSLSHSVIAYLTNSVSAVIAILQAKVNPRLEDGSPGHGLLLPPIKGLKVSAMTELLAMPLENLTSG